MMNKMRKSMAILAVGAFALGLPGLGRAAEANPPELMTYQGYLVDGNGAPLGAGSPANYDVVFRIYEAKQGGTAIWAEQQTLTVAKSADFALEAQRFCVGLGVESPQCAQHVLGKLNSAML